jgi:hypothetical protein
VEKRVTWYTDDPDFSDKADWEGTDDSCFGFYGSDYAEQCAREALANALAPAQDDDPISPERIEAAVADMQRVQANLDEDR